MLGQRRLLRLNFRSSDRSTFEILGKARNFENSTEGCALSFGIMSDRIMVMETIRKSFPGPYYVKKYKIVVHMLKKCPMSNFENF